MMRMNCESPSQVQLCLRTAGVSMLGLFTPICEGDLMTKVRGRDSQVNEHIVTKHP